MEIKDFIKDALAQIVDGVQEANAALAEKEAYVPTENIAGYSNRDDAVVSLFPVVVFGDHSCVVKYVTFDFCRGADGTQILYSIDERVSTEYLYFAVKDTKFQSGYARHFSLLKDSLIILPDKSIAKKYCELSRKYFDLIKTNIAEISSLTRQRDELLPLLMNGQVIVK